MKKISLVSILCLFLPLCGFAATASSAAAASSPFDGFYVGAQAGVVYGIFQHSSNSMLNGRLFDDQPSDYPLSTPTNDSASNLGADAGLHIGYGHVFHTRYYLGAEANGDFLTASVSAHSITSNPYNADSFATTTYTGRLSNTYGVVLRPGYLISPTLMVYLKGGVQGSHLQASSTTGYNPLIPGPAVYSTTASGSKEVVGWTTGIGIEKRASNHFGFRVEDLFSGYEGVSATTTQSFDHGLGARGTVTNTMHVNPYTNVFMVGVDYYLG